MMNERGTGRTTKQMQGAPQGAAFVWCNEYIDYAKRLARALGRDDLKIYGSGIFRGDRCRELAGISFSAVIVDHAYRPASKQEAKNYHEALTFIKALIR